MIENELKIPVDALDPIRDRLRRLGATPVSPNELEVNTLFDTADGRLAEAGRVLRIRRIGARRVLTFKGRATFDGPVKSRREIELEVASAETAGELLLSLGFVASLRYEKYRESWRLDEVQVDLDLTPMGSFAELEGPADALERAAGRLGLDPRAAVSESYLGLWNEHRRRHPKAGRDMVFDRC